MSAPFLKPGHRYRRADGTTESIMGPVLASNQRDPSWVLAPEDEKPEWAKTKPRWIVPDRVWSLGGNHYRASDGRYVPVDQPMPVPTWRDLVEEVTDEPTGLESLE